MQTFESRSEQAAAAAGILAAALGQDLAAAGPVSLIVTGGTSPGPVYDLLSQADLDWSRVTVLLSDDRFVPENDPRSNAALVRGRLLTGPASDARMIPLCDGRGAPDAAAREVEADYGAHLPPAAAILGMGEDGHIASIFPRDPNVSALLNPPAGRHVAGVAMSGLAPFTPRVTLTLPPLASPDVVILFVQGETKRRLLEDVLGGGHADLPVAALIARSGDRLRTLWAA